MVDFPLNSFCVFVFSLGTGAAGPAFFGMGLKQSLIILLVVDLL